MELGKLGKVVEPGELGKVVEPKHTYARLYTEEPLSQNFDSVGEMSPKIYLPIHDRYVGLEYDNFKPHFAGWYRVDETCHALHDIKSLFWKVTPTIIEPTPRYNVAAPGHTVICYTAWQCTVNTMDIRL